MSVMKNKKLLRYSAMGVAEYHWKNIEDVDFIMDRGAEIGIGIRFASPEEISSFGHGADVIGGLVIKAPKFAHDLFDE